MGWKVAGVCGLALAAVVALLLVLSPTSGQGQTYAGKTAAAVLDHYHLKYADLEMEDEPPGKLQAFSFVRPEDKKKVVVRLQYTPKLFSSDRKWDLQAVRAATILEVAVEPR